MYYTHSVDAMVQSASHARTMERRIAACDTVILFDLPTEVCLGGAIARLGQKRPDMPWVDTELDPRFREAIERFAIDDTPTIYALLDKYKDGRNIVIFKTRDEADLFLQSLRALCKS